MKEDREGRVLAVTDDGGLPGEEVLSVIKQNVLMALMDIKETIERIDEGEALGVLFILAKEVPGNPLERGFTTAIAGDISSCTVALLDRMRDYNDIPGNPVKILRVSKER